MVVNYIDAIPELNRPNVHIKDKDQVNKVIENLIKDGKSNLQIISDFDKTITKQHEEGKMHISSFGLFARSPSTTPEYFEQARMLTLKYQPVEMNPNIPLREKKKLIEEWYTLLSEVIRGEKVSRYELEETALKMGASLRDGTIELMTDLNKHEIPVIVFSAGLGDAVEAILKNSNILFPNVDVISNFLKYSNGVVEGFKNSSIIHVFNKNESVLQDTLYYDIIKDRHNVILMGDSLGDCEMANGVPLMKNILKIGFLYDFAPEYLPTYMDNFDIVLEDDQTMDVVRAILKQIL